MIQIPASIHKNLIHAGICVFSLLACLVSPAQSTKESRGFIEIGSSGIIPLQNFNPNLEDAFSTLNTPNPLTVVGGSASVAPQINLGLGAGASFGIAATGSLKSMFTYRAELNYSQQILTITRDFSDSETIRLQSPTVAIKMVYNPFRKTNQHLLLTVGAEIGLNRVDSYTLFSRTDSILSLPLVGDISQTTSVEFAGASDYTTNATLGALWVNHLWKNWYFSFQCNYVMPLQNTYRISSNSTVNNPIFPLETGQSSRDFNISQLRLGLALMYSIKGKENR